MPAAERRRWTAREVRELIEANPLHSPRYELIDGELLVTPSPGSPHQRMVLRLGSLLLAYLDSYPVGEVLISPSDVELEPETIVQPDVYMVPRTGRIRPGTERRARELLLAVEILSPGSGRHDRGQKRRFYQRARVPEYWIVDLDGRLIERWRPEDERPEVMQSRLEWQPPGGAVPFVVDLPALFEMVLGEEPS